MNNFNIDTDYLNINELNLSELETCLGDSLRSVDYLDTQDYRLKDLIFDLKKYKKYESQTIRYPEPYNFRIRKAFNAFNKFDMSHYDEKNKCLVFLQEGYYLIKIFDIKLIGLSFEVTYSMNSLLGNLDCRKVSDFNDALKLIKEYGNLIKIRNAVTKLGLNYSIESSDKFGYIHLYSLSRSLPEFYIHLNKCNKYDLLEFDRDTSSNILVAENIDIDELPKLVNGFIVYDKLPEVSSLVLNQNLQMAAAFVDIHRDQENLFDTYPEQKDALYASLAKSLKEMIKKDFVIIYDKKINGYICKQPWSGDIMTISNIGACVRDGKKPYSTGIIVYYSRSYGYIPYMKEIKRKRISYTNLNDIYYGRD